MVAPLTPVLDDFNRANGSLGSNWTDSITPGDVALAIASNLVKGVAASFCSGWWNVTSFGPNQEAYVDITTKPANTENAGVYVRLASPGTAGVDGYYAEMVTQSGTDQMKFFRIDNGVFTTVGSTVNQEWSAGDGLWLWVNGSTFRVYRRSSGTWSQLGSDLTDATYSAGGYIGTDGENATFRTDNFGGGTLGPSFFMQPDLLSGNMQTLAGNFQ